MMNRKHIPKLRIFSLILAVSGLLAVPACDIGPITPPVINQAPTANAGVDLQRCVGQEVTLNGLSSSDPDGDSLFYNWSSVRCAGSCDLDSANIPTPKFTPSNAGLYEFSLTVTDDRGGSDLDTIRVVVVACDGSNPCEDIECPPGTVCSLTTGVCEPICEDDAACLDDDPCTNDLCIGGACHNIAIDCDDDLFCTGVETCVDGACVSSSDPCSPGETCDEDNDGCVACLTDDDCGDGEECNPETGECEPIDDMLVITSAKLPSGRSGLACAADPVTQRIYCFGGWDGTDYLDEILEYDPANPNRDPVITATLPTARSGLACAASPATGKICCFGGYDLLNDEFLAEILEYDPGDPHVNPIPMQGTLPEGRVELACATDPATGKIYCFGGGDGINHRRDIVEYDPNTDTLKDDLTATLPPGTTGMSCVADSGSGKIYCFGGWNGTAFDQVLEYDPGADKLNDELTVRLPSGRHGLACAADRVSGRIYCFGGRELGYTAPPAFNEILEYDAAVDTLETMSAELPSENSDLACAASPATGKIYCFGGWDGTTYFDDILEYTPSVCDEDNDACVPLGALWSIDMVEDELTWIDPATGHVTVIGPLGVDATATDLAFHDGTLYALDHTGARTDIFSLDLSTGTACPPIPVMVDREIVQFAEGLASVGGELVASLRIGSNPSLSDALGVLAIEANVTDIVDYGPFAADIDGLVAGGGYDELLGLDTEPGLQNTRLYAIGRDPAAYELIGTFEHVGVHDLAFLDTSLYAIRFPNTLLRLDPTNAAVLEEIPLDTPGEFRGLASGPDDLEQGSLWSIDMVEDELTRIDPTTGHVTVIGPLGIDATATDLAFHGGTLYALDHTGIRTDIFSLDLSTGTACPPIPVMVDGEIVQFAEGLASVGGELVASLRIGSNPSLSDALGVIEIEASVSDIIDYGPFAADIDGLVAGGGLAELLGLDTEPGSQSTQLYEIGRDPAVYELIGTFDHVGVHDLAFLDTSLYAIRFPNTLLRLDPTNAAVLEEMPMDSSGEFRGLAAR